MFNRRHFLKNVALGSGIALTGAGCEILSVPAERKSDVIEIIKKRRSVRKYKSDPVPEEHIKMILDAARMAPTSGNQQPWRFLVIRDRNKIEALKQACIENSMDYFKNKIKLSADDLTEKKKDIENYYTDICSAPVYIVVLTDNQSRYASYNHHDGPLAAGNLMNAARSLGYGTVYFTDSIPEEVTSKVLNISERFKRVCITPVGVPFEWPDTPEKKSLESFISWEEIQV